MICKFWGQQFWFIRGKAESQKKSSALHLTPLQRGKQRLGKLIARETKKEINNHKAPEKAGMAMGNLGKF